MIEKKLQDMESATDFPIDTLEDIETFEELVKT